MILFSFRFSLYHNNSYALPDCSYHVLSVLQTTELLTGSWHAIREPLLQVFSFIVIVIFNQENVLSD